MARKNKNTYIPENFRDYYADLMLDKNASSKDILKALRSKQGELAQYKSAGALNSPEVTKKLEEEIREIEEAIKIFKNDDRRDEYDRLLEAAYEQGKIDMKAQKLAQNLYEEIEAMFMKGDYHGAARKCMEALDNNVRDYRIYILLARSYYSANEVDRSLDTINEGLKVHPDNISLLRTGARIANEGKNDYEQAQKFVNRMLEIDAESPLAASEQSYLYVCTGKDDLAYQMVDNYVEKHPNDMDFRRDVAYDMIGYCYGHCYTEDPESGVYVIASQEAYQKNLDSCNKAVSIYQDENTKAALQKAKEYGEVEYNEENRDAIKWSFIGGGLFCFGGIGGLLAGISSVQSGWLEAIGMTLFSLLFYGGIGAWMIYCGIKLNKLSYRPYWQINKFILTGQREPEEGKYIALGSIISWIMKTSFKIAWWLMKLIFRFI